MKICAVIFAASLLSACGPGTGNQLDSGAVSFVSAMSNGVGLRGFESGLSAITAYGVELSPAYPARGHLISAIANSGGSYTQVDAYREWVSGSWTNSTPSSTAPAATGDLILDAAGNWVAYQTAPSNALSFRQNADGSILVNDPLYGDNISYLPVAVNLGGSEILSGAHYSLGDPSIPAASGVVTVGLMENINGNGNPAFLGYISPFAKYSTNSAVWILTGGRTTRDAYRADGISSVRTPAGPLTTITQSQAAGFTLSNPLCAFGFSLVYSSQPATNTVRFDVYPPGSSCVAVASGSTLYGKVDLIFVVERGNNLVVKADNFVADPINLSAFVALYGSANPFNVRGHLKMIAPVGTKVLAGEYTPIGYHLDMDDAGAQKKGWLNKTAMDSYMSVAGIAPF